MSAGLLNSIANLAKSNDATYSSLPGPRAIRILSLQPGERKSRISFNISVVQDYSKAPVYQAVSYCWGASVDAVQILCDGIPFFVTRILHELLERLRSAKDTRVLWVDAICINQSNDAERNQQVGIMRQIYAHASRVLVWLGPSDTDTLTAIDAVHEIFDKLCRAQHMPGIHEDWMVMVRANAIDVTRKSSNVPVDVSYWQRLGPLFKCEWFRRIWVVQEAQSGRKTKVLWGEESIEWIEVVAAAKFASTRENVKSYGKTADIEFPHRRSWRTYHIAQAIFMAESPQTDVSVPFLRILEATRCFRSTDPRDKVFSMLQHPFRRTDSQPLVISAGAELPSLMHLDMKPDYTKPASTVYTDVALQSIVKSGSLEILSHYWAGSASLPGTPRWVPRWDIDYAPEHIPLPVMLYNACLSLPCRPPHGDLLRLQGVKLGLVNGQSEVLTYSKHPSDIGGCPGSTVTVDSLQTAARLSVHDTWRQGFQSGTDMPDIRPGRRTTDQFADFAAFVVERMPRPAISFYCSMVEKWCGSCGGIISRFNEGTLLPTMVYQCPGLCKGTSDICPSCYHDGVRCAESGHEAVLQTSRSLRYIHDETTLRELEPAAPQGCAERYYSLLRDTCMSRMWFSTSRGDVGSGSVAMQIGDVVAVLFGARVPFLLRQQQCGRYQLIGDCYVDGMMDGEPIRLWRGGALQGAMFELC